MMYQFSHLLHLLYIPLLLLLGCTQPNIFMVGLFGLPFGKKKVNGVHI